MRLVVFTILFLIGTSTFAQNDFYKLNFGLQSAIGFAWAHDEKVNAI